MGIDQGGQTVRNRVEDVLEATREKLTAMLASINEWEAVTLDVDFPPEE